MNFLSATIATVAVISHCIAKAQPPDTTFKPPDTAFIRGSVGVTGLIQTGDENRTVATLLSLVTMGNHIYEVEPLTSIAYSSKPGAQVEGEYLENILVRYGQEHSFYPALGLSFESSFLRKINYRLSTGLTLVYNLLRSKGQSIKLGAGYNHELTQYKPRAFIPPVDKDHVHYIRQSDQVYIRLKGKNDLFRGKLILSYDFFIQPDIKDFTDYRWTLLGSLDFPLTGKISLRASAVGSYESFVAANVHPYNFRLTYGINVSF